MNQIKPRTPAGKEINSLSRLFYLNKKVRTKGGTNARNMNVENAEGKIVGENTYLKENF